MLMGKVVGTVVATRKDPELEGFKLLMVRELTTDLTAAGGLVVAADAVGAGVGEVVLFAQGSSARLTELTQNRPVDAVIMAIVDSFDIDGEVRYQKE